MEDQSCKTSRWRMLKSQLNNLFPDDFRVGFQQQNSVIVDVRTAQEFEFGHIPNAINISYLAEDFWEKIEALSPEKNIFVYCRSGRRSIRTCTLMRNGGFENDKVFNLETGFLGWLETFPEEATQPATS